MKPLSEQSRIQKKREVEGSYSRNVESIEPLAFGAIGYVLRLLRYNKRGLKEWTIAARANLKVNEVRKILATLEEQGLVSIINKRSHKGTSQSNDTYILTKNLVEICGKGENKNEA